MLDYDVDTKVFLCDDCEEFFDWTEMVFITEDSTGKRTQKCDNCYDNTPAHLL